ncbi:heme NO-binding domain-containing protein [Andreprevotia chitinilytica]|uniref:heme NO-binding domain-containing protein n=1 Tax=Andreprevotia chitinilytica TaxID=396808 RepID=UPI0005596DFB|nr:heme NO-binding domain-containing protein [Andreprevotia chitinilytica]
MLGMVFTEFVEMVESTYSPELADEMLVAANLPHGGAYTAVGYYPHDEIIRLVVTLSQLTGTPVETLVQAFGRHLLRVFVRAYPSFFTSKKDIFELLASVDAEIHREVRKLYPDAQLPRFEVLQRDARSMTLTYRSPRSMEALAMGLMEGVAEHFGTPVTISQEKAPPPDTATVFKLELA